MYNKRGERLKKTRRYTKMWTNKYLEVGKKVVEFWAKHYEEGSDFGINGGKISKLTVKYKGETLLNYDRGWDKKPETELGRKALEKLLKIYN